MSDRYKASSRRMRYCKESARNIFDNASRFYWQSSFINQATANLRAFDSYQKLTIRDQQRIEGYIDCLRDQLDRKITHAYLCNDGKFRPDPRLEGYEKYEYPSSRSVKKIVEKSCLLVWANNPSMVHFCCDESLATLQACRAKFTIDNQNATMKLETMVEKKK